MPMHDDQLDVSAGTVAALLREQFPRWAGEEVRPLASVGTVNAIFRVGGGLVARLPLRPSDEASARALLEREASAAAELAAASPFPAPEPVALGAPGAGYPMPWAVQTWVPGTVAEEADASGSEAFARDLAELIAALRKVPTRGRRFSGTGRGGDIASSDGWVAECLAQSEGLLDTAPLRAEWARLRELPRGGPDVMCHGDLIPGNVLVAGGGRLGGVLDTGGFAPADPSLDLVGAWHLLREGPRRVLRDALGCDDVEWERGRAWAFEQAMGLVWYYVETNPPMSALGRRTLARLFGSPD